MNKRRSQNFGEAIKALKEGKIVQRSHWEGMGEFIFMQVPAVIGIDIVPKMQSLPQSVKDILTLRAVTPKHKVINDDLQSIRYKDQVALVDHENVITSWTPSVSDTLAEDWIILD